MFDRHLRVLAADAPRLHGLTPSLAIVDELHAHPSDDVYLAMLTSLAKRRGSRLIVISSAGQGADTPARAPPSPCPRSTLGQGPRRADGRARAGLRMLEWAVPEDVALTPRNVKRANPASWITMADLARQQEAVPDLAFRRFHAGQWTEREGHWLPPGAWQACVGEPELTDGERIWVGVDVGGGGHEGDTAVAWVSERLHVGCAVFSGEDGVLQARDKVEELAEPYTIAEVAFDPWRASQIAQELQQRGVRVSAFAQTDSRMIPASQALHRAVVERRVVLPADETLSAMPRTRSPASRGEGGASTVRPGRRG